MAILSRFIFKIIASDFANRLWRVAQHARRLLIPAHANIQVAVIVDIHTRNANIIDQIYIPVVTILVMTAWTKEHKTFRPQSRRQMN